MVNKSDAIEKMNTLGKAREAFLFLIDFKGEKSLILPIKSIDSKEILYQIGKYSNVEDTPSFEHENPIVFSKSPQSYQEYQKAFYKVKAHLDFGNTYLVNLTQATPIKINRPLISIFHQSKAQYKLWLKDKFVVFSPEIFVQISKGKIASFPMKGTIDANLPNAQQQLFSDPKETAEHNTIVDLIRNDLSMIAKNVEVKRFRFLQRLKTNQKDLLQMSSEIIGDVDIDFFDELGTNFFKLLPAGSISGAPKKKTLEIIEEAENYERGFYTGICGYFDGESLDSGVMIRYIEEIKGDLIFKSGGGITTFSDSEKEYQELIDKVYVPIY